MLRGGSVALPPSLLALLVAFQPCFTEPTFRTFCALAGGFLAQTRGRTVCGMLTGAGLARRWSHHRVHRFFSRARWSLDEVSGVLARLVVDLLIPPGEPVLVAVDDTLFRRSGRTVYAASWFHDGSATGRDKVGYGNNWVIAAVVVRLPFLDRPVALPVGFALVRKGTDAVSRLALGRQLVGRIAAAAPGRTVQVVADSAYAGQALRDLPAAISWTTRLRANAALSALAPPRTGKRGRPRLKGEQLPDLKTLAATTGFTPTTVHRYGATVQVHTAVIVCLWYRVFGRQPVQVVRADPRPRQRGVRHAPVMSTARACRASYQSPEGGHDEVHISRAADDPPPDPRICTNVHGWVRFRRDVVGREQYARRDGHFNSRNGVLNGVADVPDFRDQRNDALGRCISGGAVCPCLVRAGSEEPQ